MALDRYVGLHTLAWAGRLCRFKRKGMWPGRAYRFCAAAKCGRVGERCIMFIFGLVSGVVVGLLLEYALGPVRWLLNTMRVW